MSQIGLISRSLAFVMVALLGSPRTSANAVVNGDFEMGDLTGWSVVVGDFALEQELYSAPVEFTPPLDGHAFKIRPGSQSENAGLMQDVTTEIGTEYTYKFSLAARDTQPSQQMRPLGDFTFSINETALESVTLADDGDFHESFMGSFTASGSVSTLRFSFDRPSHSFTNHPQWLLDNVVIEAIPEPPTIVFAIAVLTMVASSPRISSL